MPSRRSPFRENFYTSHTPPSLKPLLHPEIADTNHSRQARYHPPTSAHPASTTLESHNPACAIHTPGTASCPTETAHNHHTQSSGSRSRTQGIKRRGNGIDYERRITWCKTYRRPGNGDRGTAWRERLPCNHIIPLSIGCDCLSADREERRRCRFRSGIRNWGGAAVYYEGGRGRCEGVGRAGDDEGGATGGEGLACDGIIASFVCGGWLAGEG